MAFNDIERKRIEHALEGFLQERWPPPEIRPKLDFSYRIKGQSVEIFGVRPAWRNRAEKMEEAIAKATYVRTRDLWKIFWMRADLKWHGYKPVPTVGSIDKFLAVVNEDRHGCFFG